MTLRFKLSAFTITVVSFTVIIALSFSFFSVRKSMEVQFYKNTDNMLASAAIDLQSSLMFGYSRAEAWANNQLVIEWLIAGEPENEAKKSIMNRLTEFASEENVIASWVSSIETQDHYITDSMKKVVYSKLNRNDPADSWFFNTLGLSEKITFNINPSKETGTTGLWINAMVFSAQNKKLGIVGCGLDLDKSVAKMKSVVPSANSILLLVDTDDNIIISSGDDEFGSSLNKYLSSSIQSVAGFEKIKTWHKNGMGKMICNSRQIGSLPYKMILIAPVNDFLPSLFSIAKGSIIATAIILFFIIFLISIGIQKTLTKRIMGLQDSFAALSSGDFTVFIKSANDELGKIAEYLNNTVSSMRKSFTMVRAETDSMKEIGSTLSSNVAEAVNVINQISTNIDDVKKQALVQASSVNETSATVEEIIKTIKHLNSNIEVQSSSVAQSSSSIEQMVANISSITQTLSKADEVIRQLSSATDDGKDTVAQSNNVTQKIAEESGSLMEASSVIQHIASQTNLLAMNAAIEAAHAGEAGKGFAVVADEIRKLAEESAAQGKTITATLKNLSMEIDILSESSKTVEDKFNVIFNLAEEVKKISHRLTESMLEQENGSKEVLDAIKNINAVTVDVHTGSAEMLKGGENAAKEMTKLDTLTRVITSSMNEMAEGAIRINTAASEVDRITQENKASIEALSNEIKKFKV